MSSQLGRLARGTAVYGLGEVINRLISFLLLPLFTAYLTPADYGVSSILGLLSMVLTPVFSLGIGASAGVVYFGGGHDSRPKTIWTAVTMLLVSASVVVAAATLARDQISFALFQTPEYGYLVAVSMTTCAISILAVPTRLYLQFEERPAIYALLTTTTTLLSIGMSLVMVVGLRQGITGLLEGTLIAQAIGFALFASVTLRELPFRIEAQTARELLRLGAPMIPSFAFLFVIQHLNKYFVQAYHGLNVLGIYTIGFNLGLFMGVLVTAFQNAWMPFFMSFINRRDEATVLFGRIFSYYLMGFGALSAMFFIWARPVTMVMTQPEFHEAFRMVGLSATAQFLAGAFSVILPAAYFAKQVQSVAVSQATAAAISVVLNLLLIPPFGLIGAGIALAVGYLSMVVFQWLWNWRHRSTYLQVRYEWGRVRWFAVIYVAIAVALLTPRSLELGIEAMISVLASCALVVSITLMTQADERRSLIRYLRRQLSPVIQFSRT